MATNIPPHNLGETIDAVCYLIDNPDAGLEDLMEYIKGPDFPTGAMIMGRAGIRAAYATGRGKITVRAVAEIVEEKNGRFKIIVTELPYQVNKARLIESIADMVKDKRIEGISNIDDHSDRNGMHIEIDLKRDASPQIVLNQLYSYTQMQTTFGVIMLAIVNGEPKTLTLKEMLQEYIKFQEEVITRRTIYDLKKARERAHILEGLKIALDNIDEIISIIRNSKDRPTAKARMTERFGLDDVQTEAIVQMRLGQLTGLERQKIEDELAALELKIKDYEDILAHEERVKAIVKDELMGIRNKYADERKTENHGSQRRGGYRGSDSPGGMRADPDQFRLRETPENGYLPDPAPGRPWNFRHEPPGGGRGHRDVRHQFPRLRHVLYQHRPGVPAEML